MIRLPSPRHRSSSRGQSLVEFALVFPVVLFLLLIAIDFGRIYLGWINLEQMTRIAANYAAEHATAWGTPGNAADRASYQNRIIQDAHLINCDPQDPIPDPVIAGGTSLGAEVRVTISCEFTVLTPVISSVVGGTVLVTAETTYPIKEGAVGVVPGGGGPITPIPVADFVASPTSGWSPLTVDFKDTSRNGPTSWIWRFNELPGPTGTGTGGASQLTDLTQGPHAVTYTCTGAEGDTCTFDVSLEVANAGGSDTSVQAGLITVTVPPATGPIAEFTGSPRTGIAPVTTNFQFVDLRPPGTITYTNYEWDFTTDGSFDTSGPSATTPSHAYAAPGSYDVTLRVTDSTGAQSTLTKTDYVIVQRPICTVPDFFNTRTNQAQNRWSAAGFTTTVQFLRATPPHYNIKYQSIVGGIIDPQPDGCDSPMTVGP
jgi:PKD repeat protein